MKITIPGKPLVWQRPKAFYKNGHLWHYDPQSKERQRLSEILLASRAANACGVWKGDLSLLVTFYVMPHGKRKTDVSNMLKALEDSGNGVLWEDDNQIRHIEAWKHPSAEDEERTEMEIRDFLYEP